jgi:hypothetical protein
MQQLVWRFSCCEQQNIIGLEIEPQPSWESFPALAEDFCLKFNLQKVSLDYGADRAQLHFRTTLGEFLLHYESLCDSIWIEVFIPNNEKQLIDFYNYISNVLEEKC